ncbi:MAG: hypothetical protein ABDH21_03120 [bacterium]
MKNLVFALVLSILVYVFIDLFYTDLPPYSIELALVRTYIYFNEPTKVEIYSFLKYQKKGGWILVPRGIYLSFPLAQSNIKQILKLNYEGFEVLHTNASYNGLQDMIGFINYKKFQENCLIYLQEKLQTPNKYIHYFDLPYFWSNRAYVENNLIIRKRENLVIMNILPDKVRENQNYRIISIKNTKKEKLSVTIF